jgi:hypothetical protein
MGSTAKARVDFIAVVTVVRSQVPEFLEIRDGYSSNLETSPLHAKQKEL